MTVNVRVLGAPLILDIGSQETPINNHRVGSVSMQFDGEKSMIRVYGYTPRNPGEAFKIAFEQALRKLCESSEVMQALFNVVPKEVHAIRFNRALAQRLRGW